MIDWAARTRALLAQLQGGGTAKTDETRVVSVSSVGVTAPSANDIDAVGTIVSVPRKSGNPYLTPEQGDECHDGGWGDAEIATFTARTSRFTAIGRRDAEHLAERLTLRDRQADDRRLCVECRELDANGRCAAARRGDLAHTDRRLEPTQNILIRCPAFSGDDSDHR